MKDPASARESNGLLPRLKCLECSAQVEFSADAVRCPQCHAEWPIQEGIPRFVRPDAYWGEINRHEAVELLEAVHQGPWKEVVLSRFTDPNMLNGLLNLQRASWLPLLSLSPNAVALDIGCGYGAITNSLALSVGHVYAVEAIPQRIEFTQERLRQEGIDNVTLVQASALALPFPDNSFDLIVVNGVLEWVGEWDLADTPRAIQLKFLSSIHRMLNHDGVVVIGIENRIGFGLFLGGLDHSGLPYTSLLPRRLASWLLRRSSRQHHRTILNAQRQYRTYTYSAPGYQKLLREAGFPTVTAYWADPGYNEPTRVIPLDAREWIRESFLYKLNHSTRSDQVSARSWAKKAFARSGLLPWFVPDFLLVAPKTLGRKTELDTWLREILYQRSLDGELRSPDGDNFVFAAGTHPNSDKSVLRVWKPKPARDRLIIKCNVRPPRRRRENVNVELANLERVYKELQRQGVSGLETPEPLGSFQIAKTHYVVESSARGVQMSNLVRKPGYSDNLEAVRKDFAEAIGAAVKLTNVLRVLPDVTPIDASWYEVPVEIKAEPKLAEFLGSARYLSNARGDTIPLWIQHGDFSVENVFLKRETAAVEIIDWGELASGLPPLYDVFSLILSSGLLDPSRSQTSFATEEERWQASFSDLLLSRRGVGAVFRELIAQALSQLGVSPDLLPALLLEFLLIRTHYYRSQDETFMARIHVNFLGECLRVGGPPRLQPYPGCSSGTGKC